MIPSSHTAVAGDIAAYWDTHIHDLAIATHPAGSAAFFDELDDYRFDKLHYLPRLVDFDGYAGRRLLEVGCGVGIDLVRFAAGGARVSGVDLSPRAIALAGENFARRGLVADLQVMDGAALAYPNAAFDVVYAHGVIQYAADPAALIAEMRRVLRPGGQAILMVYNRRSWLTLLSKVTAVDLEHADAPALRFYTAGELRRLLTGFEAVRIIPERFPVKTRLHGGLKGAVYNSVFVNLFNVLPRRLVRPYGWHLMAFATRPA